MSKEAGNKTKNLGLVPPCKGWMMRLSIRSWVNKMERAATTTSSLEVEQDSEQFWQTAALSTTEDGVRGITATIDRKVKTYHAALTKLIKRVKKLEQTIKISQARRRAKVVISNAEEDKEDPSKQGRNQGRIDDTQISDQPEEQLGSTAGVKAKDKGKAIMQEFEPPKKIKKRVQVQMSVDEELAKNQLDKREEVVAQAHDIDWSDPAVLRYHTLQNRPFSVAEVRKNMCMYLKNQGGYKLSHFKGMRYEDIRPIFERVWDQNQAFVPKDSEIEKEVMKRSEFDLQQEFVTKDEASSFAQKQPAKGSKKKSLARKRAKRNS
ncbi:hypothetical protein Tco_0111815 [Tanacetum coccineum]